MAENKNKLLSYKELIIDVLKGNNSFVSSNDSVAIAECLKDFEYNPSKRDEIIRKYQMLVNKYGSGGKN